MSEFSKKQAEEQHKLGKLTAEERIGKIVDAGSFVEIDKYLERSNAVLGYPDVCAPGEGVVAGWATIEGRPVYLFAQDYTVLKGSLGAAHAAKITKVMDMAAKAGLPVICVWDSDGARVQEGAAALGAYASIMKKLTDISGVVPTISIAAGGMLGCAAVLAALTDFTIAVEKISAVSLVSPMVLASTAGIDVNEDAICGAKIQSEETGIAQFACASEEQAVETLKDLLRYLPSNNLEESPYEIVEDDAARATVADGSDVRALIRDIADNNEFLEVAADYSDDMITGFITLNGYTAGVIANAPGKTISFRACRKASRFISLLDAYDIPMVTLVNNEGVEVSLEGAQHCQIRTFAKLVSAYAESGAPMVSVITGKAVGEGYIAMGNKNCGADIVYAYPTAEISCLEAEAGSIILFDTKAKAAEYKEKFASPLAAAQQGLVDDIIEPADTRLMLIKAIEMASNKREQKLPKKHSILPL